MRSNINVQEDCCQQVKGGDLLPFLSSGVTLSWAQFGAPVQERHGHATLSPAKGCEVDKRSRACFVQGESNSENSDVVTEKSLHDHGNIFLLLFSCHYMTGEVRDNKN